MSGDGCLAVGPARRGRGNRTSLILGFLTLGGLLAFGPAAAQDVAPSPRPAEPPKIDVTGFVDVYYLYDFNKVDPALRSFDVQHNAFSLSLAEIAFAMGVATDSRVGFRIDLDFGKTADLIAAYEPEEDGKVIYKHVQQAYPEPPGRQQAAACSRT